MNRESSSRSATGSRFPGPSPKAGAGRDEAGQPPVGQSNGAATRPGLPAGVEPLPHLRRVVEAAVQRTGKRAILVLTHTSPDPDALGACVGARFLLEKGLGMEPRVATVGKVHRAENIAMVRELELSFGDYSDLQGDAYCGAVLVDSQPGFGHTLLPEDVPVLAVMDHHEAAGASPYRPGVPHNDVRIGLGATSSLVYAYIRDAGLTLDKLTATALFCGVRFDTGDLSHNASDLDEEAYFQTLRYADRRSVARIRTPRLPTDYYRELARSLRVVRKFGPLTLALLGEVKNPESVAEMADFLLRMEGCRWTLVGGAYNGVYSVSLRTQYDFIEAYPLLGRVLERGDFHADVSYGGHGRVAGGRLVLHDPSIEGIRRLERRLRSSALSILDAQGGFDSGARFGVPLS